ncbi:MAG: hypothetical protein J7M25_08190 [Deltaproteobacteria bacterium]|nr:hypothetical protein [Deltaproteobacteria bacterium]
MVSFSNDCGPGRGTRSVQSTQATGPRVGVDNRKALLFPRQPGASRQDDGVVQRADRGFVPAVTHPAYPSGKGPVLCLDEAHHDYHRVAGRFRAFCDLARLDGYRVRSLRQAFSSSSLKSCGILVIANALAAENVHHWRRPVHSAFSGDEIAAVRQWVIRGGRLLLIADHMPFSGSSAGLARAFGIHFLDGFVFAMQGGTRRKGILEFRRRDRTLADHAVTRGRNASEFVDQVTTFTGQAFTRDAEAMARLKHAVSGPVHFSPLLLFGPSVVSFQPAVAWRFSPKTPRVNVTGWWQGAVAHVGAGRLALFGEAAMFTAQVQCRRRRHPSVPGVSVSMGATAQASAGAGAAMHAKAGRPTVRRRCRAMGLGHPKARQNPEFILNLLHWLSGIL